jgi:hypothetical protein
MNTNNLAQKTNFTAGSDQLQFTPFYLTSVNIPGVNFSHPELGGRSGTKFNVTSDNITYNPLSFEMLLDEDFKIYHEFMRKINKSISPETGKFESVEFDFWVVINNNKSSPLFKMEFHNCRIETISDIQLDVTDDMTEHTLSVDIKYDYFEIVKTQN